MNPETGKRISNKETQKLGKPRGTENLKKKRGRTGDKKKPYGVNGTDASKRFYKSDLSPVGRKACPPGGPTK